MAEGHFGQRSGKRSELVGHLGQKVRVTVVVEVGTVGQYSIIVGKGQKHRIILGKRNHRCQLGHHLGEKVGHLHRGQK